MNNVERRLVAELLRALDGKYGGTYPQMIARRVSQLSIAKKYPALYEDEINFLGGELLRLVETGDTKTLRRIADARDHVRKDGEVFNRKRYDRLRTYLLVYEREGRPPKIGELIDKSGDDGKDINNERAIRKLLDDLDLPYTPVPTGHPKGKPNSTNAERLRQLRSLLNR